MVNKHSGEWIIDGFVRRILKLGLLDIAEAALIYNHSMKYCEWTYDNPTILTWK